MFYHEFMASRFGPIWTVLFHFTFLFFCARSRIAYWIHIKYYNILEIEQAFLLSFFQLFKASHIFEKYDLVYKRYFGFEKDEQQDLSYKMPLRFIWGIQPLDEGSYLDPGSRGKMVLDPEFDISSTDSQRWMLRFCQQVRKQPFYKPTQGPLLSNCFMETFKEWMERRCKDELTGEDR